MIVSGFQIRAARMGPKLAAVFLMISLFFLAASGCENLPSLGRIHAIRAGENPPEIIDSDRRFSNRESEAVIDRLKQEAGPTDILERHMRQVEKITGSPLIHGNRVRLLRDGPETFAAMTQAIRQAQLHIHLETFIIQDDEVGRPLADLLLEKQAEGVQVKLIYDSIGSRTTPRAFFERMRDGGIQVYEFNPADPLDLVGKWTLNNRDHRKILVVDGKVAFTGGINFYRVYAGSPSSGAARGSGNEEYYWRDTHVRIEGPAVAEFQKLFLQMWSLRKEKEKFRPDFFPPLENRGDTLVQVISSTPDQPVPNIYATYMSAILNAEKTIHITQAYFVPDDEMLEALSRSAQQDVDVKIIVPGVSDFWMPIYAGRSKYSNLLKSGVKLYERRGALLHSKTAVIDGVWSTVGSSNLDSRSFLHDAEVNAIILGTDFAEKMEEMFEADLAESDEVILEEWEKRPLMNRILERVALFFKYWL